MIGARIHGASPETIENIERQWPDHIVSRFDLAIDFITSSSEDSTKLISFLRHHITQPWHGRRNRLIDYKNTIYFDHKKAFRGIKLYPTISKIVGKPAAHLELKYSTARTCKLRKIHKISDLINLDLDKFLERDIKLSDINFTLAERILCRAAEEYAKLHHISLKAAREIIENKIFDRMNSSPLSWEDFIRYPIQTILDTYPPFRKCALHYNMLYLV
jgi:hypothetical protein